MAFPSLVNMSVCSSSYFLSLKLKQLFNSLSFARQPLQKFRIHLVCTRSFQLFTKMFRIVRPSKIFEPLLVITVTTVSMTTIQLISRVCELTRAKRPCSRSDVLDFLKSAGIVRLVKMAVNIAQLVAETKKSRYSLIPHLSENGMKMLSFSLCWF